MEEDGKTKEVTASIEKLTNYNMLLFEALFEIDPRGGTPVIRPEVSIRIAKLRAKTNVNILRLVSSARGRFDFGARMEFES
jgi:hypothetical protein